MRELVDAKSAAEGRNSSRLPSFDAAWTRIINGIHTWGYLNHLFLGSFAYNWTIIKNAFID